MKFSDQLRISYRWIGLGKQSVCESFGLVGLPKNYSVSIRTSPKSFKTKRDQIRKLLQNKREPFLKAPSLSKEVALNCGIASRSNPTYLPFLSLMNLIINLVLQRYINIINQCK